MTDGSCLRDAFLAAGIEVATPDWLPIEDVPKYCGAYGAVHTGGSIIVTDTDRLIMIYSTTQGRAHAVFVDHVGRWFAEHPKAQIVGIIVLYPAPARGEDDP